MRVLKQLFGDGIKNGMGTDMAYVTTEVEVEVDLDEFDDETLIDELESRGLNALGHFDDIDLIDELKSRGYDSDPEELNTIKELITHIYELRKLNKPYENEVDALIYHTIGKIL